MEIKYYITVDVPDKLANDDFDAARDNLEDEFRYIIHSYGFKTKDMEIKVRINIFDSEFEKHGIDVNESNFSEIAVNYIQDHYFNGADSAIVYIGYAWLEDNIIFEFDMIPN